METLIIIAKSATILSLFYMIYLAILCKDTFYTANRHFLISGIVAALVLPFITFTKVIYTTIPDVAPIVSNDFKPEAWEALPPVITETPIDWWQVALVIYMVGIAIMGIRFAVQLISLLKLIHSNTKVHKDGYTFVKTNTDLSPFSFFKYIVYNPALHTERELELILTHEKVHASQWHTIDVLLTQLILSIQWINPLAWLYRKSLEQNLEFIADHAAINTVDSTKEYQLTLVKVSSTALRPALTNQFYHSLIKKRIVMLNREASRRRNLWKLGLVLPVLGLFMYSFNVETEYKIKEDFGASDTFAKAAINNRPERTFTLQATMTDEQLNSLITLLESDAQNVSIQFNEKTRNSQNELTGISVATKYPHQEEYINGVRLENNDEKAIDDIVFQIVNDNDLQFYKVKEITEAIYSITEADGVKVNLRDPLTSNTIQLGDSSIRIGKTEENQSNQFVMKPSPKGYTQFLVTPASTKEQLKSIETYFNDTFKSTQVKFDNLNFKEGKLFSLNFKTKMKDEKRFTTRFSSYATDENPISAFSLKPIKEHLIHQTYGDGRVVKFTPENSTTQIAPLKPSKLSENIKISKSQANEKTVQVSQQLVKEEVSKVAQNLTSAQDDTYKFVITKNTTVEELKALKQKLKDDHNASLKYSDVDFNEQGEITSIKLKFKDGYGNSSNYHTSSQTAIRDIYIYREADGRNGIGNYGSSAELEEEMEKRLFKRRERMEARQGEMEERRQDLLEKREVRREEMQKRREGMREEMKFRSEGARQEMRERRREMEKHKKEIFGKIKAQERRKSLFSDDSALDEIPSPQSATVPLYILDEKEVKYEDIKTLLDPNKIKSVSVLKGKSALALYGSKGKNGVIVIESKE